MASPGTATVISQTVTALCHLLLNVVQLVESPFPPTSAQLEDAFYTLCSALQDVPLTVVVNAPNIPRTPSPLFQSSARLPEFGEDGRIPPTIDTPASTTAELGHQTEASPVAAAQDLPLLATNVANPTTEELDWEFAFGDPDVIDHSPPERPPTPVSLVHLAACHCPAPNGHMSMGIKCGPCSIYDSITAASLHGTED